MVKQGIVFANESEPGEWPGMTAGALLKVGLMGLVDTYGRIGEFHGHQDSAVTFSSHLLEEEDISDEALLTLRKSKKTHRSLYMAQCMENVWRKELIFKEYGKSSVELYDEYGLLDDEIVLFHGIHLNVQDINLLSESGSSVVHCLITNFWTGAGASPVGDMLEKGVNVCIGTDYGSINI